MPKASEKTASATTGSRAKTSAKAATSSSAPKAGAKAAPASVKRPRASTKAAPEEAAASATPAPVKPPRASAKSKPAETSAAPASDAPKRTRASVKAKPVEIPPAPASPETDGVDENEDQDQGEARVNKRNTMPGHRLIKEIKKVIVARGLPDREIADVMGVTVIYWNSLVNGNRQIQSLGKAKLQKIAEFLALPLIQVYNLADYFTPSDFVYVKDLDETLWLSVEKMAKDPQWAGYIPTKEDWDATPLKVRMTLIVLYEQLSRKQLFAKAEIEVPGFPANGNF